MCLHVRPAAAQPPGEHITTSTPLVRRQSQAPGGPFCPAARCGKARLLGPLSLAQLIGHGKKGLGLISPKLSDHLYGAAAPETSLGAIGVGQGVLS